MRKPAAPRPSRPSRPGHPTQGAEPGDDLTILADLDLSGDEVAQEEDDFDAFDVPLEGGFAGERAEQGEEALTPRRSDASVTRLNGGGAVGVFSRRGPAREQALGMPAVGRTPVVSMGLRDRLAEQRRALWHLRGRRAMRTGGVILLILILIWAIGFSPLLGLQASKVQVAGLDGTVSAAQVRAVVAKQEGTSLLRLNLRGIGEDIAANLVRVRSAAVTRQWPHGLKVTLTMREPVAALKTSRGYDILDADAVVLETVTTAPSGLVVITMPAELTSQTPTDSATPSGEASAQPSPTASAIPSTGSQASPQAGMPTADQVRAVAAAAGALDAKVRKQVGTGSASASGQVSFELTSGAHVVWGDTEDLELKSEVLTVLLQHPASIYDVSSPRSPTTR